MNQSISWFTKCRKSQRLCGQRSPRAAQDGSGTDQPLCSPHPRHEGLRGAVGTSWTNPITALFCTLHRSPPGRLSAGRSRHRTQLSAQPSACSFSRRDRERGPPWPPASSQHEAHPLHGQGSHHSPAVGERRTPPDPSGCAARARPGVSDEG